MLKTVTLTGIIIIVFFLFSFIGLGHLLHQQKWVMLIFFVSISFLLNLFSKQGLSNNRENFVTFYLASIVSRLILCIIFVGVELYLDVPDVKIFIINFFVLYLCYTVFEISELYRNLRQNS
jgi:hypothetical protein